MISEQKAIPKLMTGLLDSYLKDDESLDLQLVKQFQVKQAADDFRVRLRYIVSALIDLKSDFGFEGDIDGVPLKGLEFALKKCARVYLGLEAVRVNETTREVYESCTRETPLTVVPFPEAERTETDEQPENEEGPEDNPLEQRAGGDGRDLSGESAPRAS